MGGGRFTDADRAMMAEAIREARLALDAGEVPVGAVVARGGEVVGRGRNRREASGDPTAHAEIEAIRGAAVAIGGWRLSDCALYVTMEPCAMCAGAAVAARLSRLAYGARDARSGCAGSVYRIPEDPAFNHFCLCDGGLLADECEALLKGFFASERGAAPPCDPPVETR